ncbi:MAG: hypothetical protein CL844_06395 [Crocinitomicaceae bacterium]|nr:hypothetical protein [Crocinitomicaceae bacterium]|tara:strand:+ start:36661 stop:37236 length:576 start_codon:yes stop_codon:yes gene_type:complete
MAKNIKSSSSINVREIFQNQYDSKINSQDFQILMSHFGLFPQNLISKISLTAEQFLIDRGEDKKIVKRVFSILLEGLNNIRIHGIRDELDRQLGYFILAFNQNQYEIIMANIINSSEKNKIEDYIELINSYSEEKIRDTYISILSTEFLSKEERSGLGFITTRMKSDNPLEYNFYELNKNKMLFTFSVMLD